MSVQPYTVTISFELDSDYKEEDTLEEENLSKNLSDWTALLVEDNELNMRLLSLFWKMLESMSSLQKMEKRQSIFLRNQRCIILM